jgi:hypothetical protein
MCFFLYQLSNFVTTINGFYVVSFPYKVRKVNVIKKFSDFVKSYDT